MTETSVSLDFPLASMRLTYGKDVLHRNRQNLAPVSHLPWQACRGAGAATTIPTKARQNLRGAGESYIDRVGFRPKEMTQPPVK